MNIDQLCDFLQSVEGEGYVTDKIHPKASIISLKIGLGLIEFCYRYKNMFTNVSITCEQADNELMTIMQEKVKEDPKIHSQKNLKKLFKKKVK